MKKVLIFLVLINLCILSSCLQTTPSNPDPGKSGYGLSMECNGRVAFSGFLYSDNLFASNLLTENDKEHLKDSLTRSYNEAKVRNPGLDPLDLDNITMGIAIGNKDGENMIEIGPLSSSFYSMNNEERVFESNLNYSFNDIVEAFSVKFGILLTEEELCNTSELYDLLGKNEQEYETFYYGKNDPRFESIELLESGHEIKRTSFNFYGGINLYFRLNKDGSSDVYYGYYYIENGSIVNSYFVYPEDIEAL